MLARDYWQVASWYIRTPSQPQLSAAFVTKQVRSGIHFPLNNAAGELNQALADRSTPDVIGGQRGVRQSAFAHHACKVPLRGSASATPCVCACIRKVHEIWAAHGRQRTLVRDELEFLVLYHRAVRQVGCQVCRHCGPHLRLLPPLPLRQRLRSAGTSEQRDRGQGALIQSLASRAVLHS